MEEIKLLVNKADNFIKAAKILLLNEHTKVNNKAYKSIFINLIKKEEF